MPIKLWKSSFFVLVSIAWVGLTAHAALPTEGLVLRYETVGDSPYTLDGNSVTSWTNQAGTVNAVRVDNSTPSLLATATPLGMPALYFDGDAKYLAANAIATLDNKNTLSWFVVFKADQLGERTTIRTGYTNNGNLWGSYLENNQFQQHTRTAAGGWAGINPPFTDTVNWHVSSAVWNGTAAELNGNAATTFYSFLNGMELGSRSDATFVPQQHTVTYVGRTAAPWTNYWNGKIAAILVYDTALSAEDRQQVEAYLMGTYLSRAVRNPSPADEEMGIDPEGLVLNWDAPVIAEELAYNVYLGTADDPTMFVSQGQTATHFIVPGQLSYDTTYSWRVDVKDADTSDLLAAGDVWSFTTGGGIWNPSPADGQRGVKLDVSLSWTGDEKSAGYDVYLGQVGQSLELKTSTAETTYIVGQPLNEFTDYQWRIDSRDSEGRLIATGEVWTFRTISTSGLTASGLPAEGLLEPFMGEPHMDMQQLFTGQRLPNVAVATDGTVISVWGWGTVYVRRSEDGGQTWGPSIHISNGLNAGGLTVDENTGDILVFVEEKHPPAPLEVFRSKDHGKTWQAQETIIHPDCNGNAPSMCMNEHGITLRHGKHAGRLIRPSRVYAGGNDREFWPEHYTNAIYSDDGGKTWQTSAPFPANGTGEATLAELSDGRIYYNSRRHWAPDGVNARMRWIAWSDDGGATWKDLSVSDVLPDGEQHRDYGLMAGLVRLPVSGRDILIFSNIVSSALRHNGHVWASFDGGKTWPVKRRVYEGAFAYSSLDTGRPGTPSEGWIYVFFEGGPNGGGTMARFNLAWLIEGELADNGEMPDWVTR